MRHLANFIRRSALGASLACAAALIGCAQPAHAVGSTLDVAIVDRDSGQALEVYHARGRHYVAGRPGARYAIRVTNHSADRVMAVMSVDGVNIITGQTASWNQAGYVFEPGQSSELAGWRKSSYEIAAFEFTALPDSYAAQTGRPLDVGVIGVAVFRERVVAPPPYSWRERGGVMPAPSNAPAAKAESALGALAQRNADAAQDRLGTGHGARESSYAARTSFERSTTSPIEIVAIQYDRFENLVSAGIVQRAETAAPRAFPGSPWGFVPDPPRW